MRNLKKVLSLALAMVMLIGMMVVGAGAANYTDASDIKNKEAVAVVSGIEVLLGVDDGSSFNPTGILTRAEAAMVIARLDLGPTAAAALKGNGTNNFSDVSSNHWAIGAIDYCAEQGHILGDGAGKFMPDGKVTGVQFALMLTRLLGYNSKAENVTGSSWAASAAALARRAGLTTGVAANTADMTRDDMAQMVFNALKADMVEYADGTGTIIDFGNGATVTTGAHASKIMHKTGDTRYDSNKKVGADEEVTVKLCEMKFSGLTLRNTKDDFNRDATVWSFDREELFVKADAADVTITEKTSEDALKKLLPKGVKLAGGKVTPEYFGDGSGEVKTLAEVAKLTGSGKKVELYINDEDEITDIFVTTYTVEKVKAVTEKDDATTYTFTKTAGSYKNDEDATNCVIAGAVEKDDVVTTVKANNKIYVYPTTSFTGNQTAKRTSGDVTTLTISGESFVLGTDVKTGSTTKVDRDGFTNSDKEATYYVDVNNFIVMIEDAEVKTAEYAMIVNAVCSKGGDTLDSAGSHTMNVRAVLADGTVQDFALALHKGKEADEETDGHLYAGKVYLGNPEGETFAKDAVKAVKGLVWGYTLNDDGAMVLENTTSTASLTSGTSARVINKDEYNGATSCVDGKGVTALFNSKTVFVLYSVDDNNKVTAEAPVTGVADLKVKEVKAGYLQAIVSGAGNRGTASVVFIQGDVASEKNYVYVTKADNQVGENWEFDGITPDGSAVTVWKKTNDVKTGLYEYNVDDGELGKAVTPGTVGSDVSPKAGGVYSVTADIDGEMLKVGKNWINISETTVNYMADGVDEIIGGTGLIVIMDSSNAGEIAAIYVTAPGAGSATLTLDEHTIHVSKLGDAEAPTAKLAATFDDKGTGLTVTKYEWTSGEKSVATVAADTSSDGEATVTWVGKGMANVKVVATLSNGAKVSDTCEVYCYNPTLTVEADKPTIDKDNTTATVTATFVEDDAPELEVKSYKFESSDEKFATCTASGNTATVTHVAAGKVTITVTATLSNGKTLTGTVEITCE